ncbi:MAG: hypothetical protein SP4CHLAM5_02190 [Chlamydiia bacterium]|nr:hypothetical protein [Chlamydiia bacterium]MCH9618093.1 hypothetical protein [Chlamydiia bacterium]MCH9623973.1 hypothetical protein [Chlamydiia bacterium]
MTASIRLPADIYQNKLLQTLGVIDKDTKFKRVKYSDLHHEDVVVISRTSGKRNYAILKEFSGYDRKEVAHRITVHFFDAGSSDHTQVIIKDVAINSIWVPNP